MELTVRKSELEIIEGIKDNYTAQTRKFTTWLRESSSSINSESIKLYFQYLNESSYKAKTIRVMRQAVKKRVRQLFKDTDANFKMRLEAELKEVDDTVKCPKVNTENIESNKILTKEEYKSLLANCRSDRQRSFVEFLFTTGCRVDELTGVELSQCKAESQCVYMPVLGKGKKERTVRIPLELFTFIKDTFRGSQYLFETSGGKRYDNNYISKQIKKIGQLRERNISAHTLRHSFITNAIKEHPDKIDAISKYVGHSSVSITLQMYNHTALTDDELFNLAA